MAGKPQHLTLTPEQDEQLRRIERSPHVNPKVRLRAQVIRLNAAGWSRRAIAKHTRRTYGTVCQDLKRWSERGLDGLADAPATNQPEKITKPIRTFVLERLQEERTWTCSQLIEAIQEAFGIRVGREALRLRILQLGYCWKRTRYVPCQEVDPEVLREHQASLETLKKGALDKRLTLFYLDEVGFSLALPVTYTWSKRGSKNRLRVPTRWGSSGRLNLIGALSWHDKKLHFELLEGSVTSERIIAFVTALTKDAKAGRVSVVVLDNAGFHTSTLVQAKRPVGGERDVYLRHLPPYSPHLNRSEALWKRVKAFLLPRRLYASVADLRRAVLEVLDVLGAVRINSCVGGA